MITRSFLEKKIRCQEKNSGTAGPNTPNKYQLCNIRFMIIDQVQLGEVLSWLHHPNSEDRPPSHPASRHIWVTLG